MYRIVGKFGELTRSEHLAKESLANYGSVNKLLIVSTNLNGFSLVNHGRFAKFAKLSPCQPFLLYGIRESTASLASWDVIINLCFCEVSKMVPVSVK